MSAAAADVELQTSWNGGLIALSYALATLGSVTALYVMKQRTGASGARNWALLWAGAVAIGFVGIWCMHFTGMSALQLVHPTTGVRVAFGYSAGFTVLSVVLAVVVLAVGFGIAGDPDNLRYWRIVLAGVLGGCGVAVMHYTGMAAMVVGGEAEAARMHWDVPIIALSVVIAVVAATAALLIFFRFQSLWKADLKVMFGAALLMAGAVCAMHYTGMFAATWRVRPDTGTSASFTLSGYTKPDTLLAVLLPMAVVICGAFVAAIQLQNRRLAALVTATGSAAGVGLESVKQCLLVSTLILDISRTAAGTATAAATAAAPPTAGADSPPIASAGSGLSGESAASHGFDRDGSEYTYSPGSGARVLCASATGSLPTAIIDAEYTHADGASSGFNSDFVTMYKCTFMWSQLQKIEADLDAQLKRYQAGHHQSAHASARASTVAPATAKASYRAGAKDDAKQRKDKDKDKESHAVSVRGGARGIGIVRKFLGAARELAASMGVRVTELGTMYHELVHNTTAHAPAVSGGVSPAFTGAGGAGGAGGSSDSTLLVLVRTIRDRASADAFVKAGTARWAPIDVMLPHLQRFIGRAQEPNAWLAQAIGYYEKSIRPGLVQAAARANANATGTLALAGTGSLTGTFTGTGTGAGATPIANTTAAPGNASNRYAVTAPGGAATAGAAGAAVAVTGPNGSPESDTAQFMDSPHGPAPTGAAVTLDIDVKSQPLGAANGPKPVPPVPLAAVQAQAALPSPGPLQPYASFNALTGPGTTDRFTDRHVHGPGPGHGHTTHTTHTSQAVHLHLAMMYVQVLAYGTRVLVPRDGPFFALPSVPLHASAATAADAPDGAVVGAPATSASASLQRLALGLRWLKALRGNSDLMAKNLTVDTDQMAFMAVAPQPTAAPTSGTGGGGGGGGGASGRTTPKLLAQGSGRHTFAPTAAPVNSAQPNAVVQSQPLQPQAQPHPHPQPAQRQLTQLTPLSHPRRAALNGNGNGNANGNGNGVAVSASPVMGASGPVDVLAAPPSTAGTVTGGTSALDASAELPFSGTADAQADPTADVNHQQHPPQPQLRSQQHSQPHAMAASSPHSRGGAGVSERSVARGGGRGGGSHGHANTNTRASTVMASAALTLFQEDVFRAARALGERLGTARDLTGANLLDVVVDLTPTTKLLLFVVCEMKPAFPDGYDSQRLTFVPLHVFQQLIAHQFPVARPRAYPSAVLKYARNGTELSNGTTTHTHTRTRTQTHPPAHHPTHGQSQPLQSQPLQSQPLQSHAIHIQTPSHGPMTAPRRSELF